MNNEPKFNRRIAKVRKKWLDYHIFVSTLLIVDTVGHNVRYPVLFKHEYIY